MCIHIIHNMPVTHMSKIIIFFNQINAQHRHDKTFQPQLDAIKFIFPPISLDVVIFAWRVLHRTRIIFCWSFSLEISVGELIKFNCIKNRTIVFKLDEICVGTARYIHICEMTFGSDVLSEPQLALCVFDNAFYFYFSVESSDIFEEKKKPTRTKSVWW